MPEEKKASTGLMKCELKEGQPILTQKSHTFKEGSFSCLGVYL